MHCSSLNFPIFSSILTRGREIGKEKKQEVGRGGENTIVQETGKDIVRWRRKRRDKKSMGTEK